MDDEMINQFPSVDIGNILDEQEQSNNLVTDDNHLINEKEKRNKSYTQLIDTYSNYIQKTGKFKILTRWISFLTFIAVFLVVVATSIYIMYTISQKNNVNIADIATVVSSCAAMIAAIIVIPQKIVDFIFNKDEDSYIIELIKHILNFDK